MVFLTNLNLSKNELQNAVIQPLSTAPSNAKQGQIYFDTVDLVLKQYDGTQWRVIGSTYVLPAATTSDLGGVIVGNGLSVDETGEISVNAISFTDLTNVPTTISGYGITDASISGQTITLGSDTVSVPTATSTTPAMDGSASVGSETTFAKGDHVHPTDTSRAPTSHASSANTYGVGNASNYGHLKLSDATDGTSSTTGGVAATPKAVSDALSAATGAIPGATSTTPKMDGTAAVGSETTYAKGDHVHPTDTSRAPTSHATNATTYGAGTGTNYGHVKLSDSTSSTSSTNGGTAATPAAVKAVMDAIPSVPSASTTTPSMDGTASYGSGTTWARADHVHPTDTSRAPLASPDFTGTPTAPTAANGTNTTQIATTAFVQNTLSYSDAMIFKGTIGAAGDSPTVTSLPNTHNAGWTYKVITAGTYASKACEIGDLIICVKDGTAAADADWTVVQTNIDGAVTGPASSTSGHIPTFNGTSGKVIQDGYGVASSISNDSTTIPTTAAVNTAVTGLVKTASGTISTSQTSASVSYSGTLINAYATMSGSIVQLDKAVAASSVTFSTAASPASAVTCTVVYV